MIFLGVGKSLVSFMSLDRVLSGLVDGVEWGRVFGEVMGLVWFDEGWRNGFWGE